MRKQFTGYERDNETDLDFAEARYYNPMHGRFTAVDPLLASGRSADPQTFNRYAYTMNRPLILTDSTGLQAGQKDLASRARRIRVPKSVSVVGPKAPGTYSPSRSTNDGPGPLPTVSATYNLTPQMRADLSALQTKAYQLQFVITKDNLNEAANGRIAPQSGQSGQGSTQGISRTDERSASVSPGFEIGKDSKVSAGSEIGAKQSQTQQEESSEQQSESGPVVSGDTSKAETFDILADDINNLAVKYEGTILTGTLDGTGETRRATMQFDFFTDTAKAAIARSREEAMKRAVQSVPHQ